MPSSNNHRSYKQLWLRLVAICLYLLPPGYLALAQQPSLKLHISSNQLHPGDTLDFIADYSIGNRQLPPATFTATLENEDNKVWQMRWPLVNGHAEASIVFPAQIKPGRYTLAFAVQPRSLRFYGQMVYPQGQKFIATVLSNKHSSQVYTYAPDELGRFAIDEFYFEDTVQCSFAINSSSGQIPMVQLDAWLDSSFLPASYGVTSLAVNDSLTQFETISINKNDFFKNNFERFYSRYPLQKKLAALQNQLPLALYDSLYVPAAFHDFDAVVLNCLTDSVLLQNNSAYDALLKIMPGLEFQDWELSNYSNQKAARQHAQSDMPVSERMIFWQNNWYRIYFNSAYGDLTTLLRRPDHYAMIYILPPPFYKHPVTGKGFGVIGLFERKYPFASPEPFGHSFLLKGYSPQVYSLPIQ